MNRFPNVTSLCFFTIFSFSVFTAFLPKSSFAQSKNKMELDQSKLSSYTYPQIAADMLDRVIKDQDVSKHMDLLKNANVDDLQKQLNNDALRMCFWIDVYNGNSQYLLKKNPEPYKKDRNGFFKKDQIEVAGYKVSMNDIEHGVLRRGATIWSKGFIRIPWRNSFVRHFKVSNVDWHIHFALNCGAKSCPPVCVYYPDRSTEQLDKAADYYLNKECEYSKEKEMVKVPALMTWFSCDFGSKNDKRAILKEYKVIPNESKPKIEYKDYDWTIKIENYKQF